MKFGWSVFNNNKASSVASYGNSSCAVFWDGAAFTGSYITFSRPGLGGIYRDPNLSNGGGKTGYVSQNWDNRISSQNWQKCG